MIDITIGQVADKHLVKEIVKTKLGVDTPPELLLDCNIDEIEQTIKNYCNIAEIPKQLTYTWANMVCDLHNHDCWVNKDNNSKEDDFGNLQVNGSDVNSVRVGNTTVSFGSGGSTNSRKRALNSHMANLDDLILNYREQLNKFRKMVW